LAKTRISITIDDDTAKAIELYYREKVKVAAEKGGRFQNFQTFMKKSLKKAGNHDPV